MDPGVESQPPVVIFKKRKGGKQVRKRIAVSSHSDSDDNSRLSSDSDGKPSQIIKKRKIASKATASTEVQRAPEEAARTNPSEAPPKLPAETASQSSSTQNHSTSSAAHKTSTNQTPTDVPKQSIGPVKATSNVRITITTDYQPDVCKDYKQTGFCGFGDGCKFLHAREDYQQGWALDREWEMQTGGKKPTGTIVSSAGSKDRTEEAGGDDSQLEKIPFKCIVCTKDYRRPIVTQCGHYFCEQCAFQKYKKNPSCAACGTNTHGVFKVAKNLQKMLDRKRKREERLQAEAEGEKED